MKEFKSAAREIRDLRDEVQRLKDEQVHLAILAKLIEDCDGITLHGGRKLGFERRNRWPRWKARRRWWRRFRLRLRTHNRRNRMVKGRRACD